MPVKALPDPVARQQPENLRALIAAVSGRVVQKAELFVIPGCFQACLQPPELTAEDFFIVRALLLLLVEPAAGAAERCLAVKIAVVVQDEHVVPAVRGAEMIEFCCRRPPVVVVSLENDFPARNFVEEGKVLFCLLDAERPAEVSEQHGRVARRNHGKPLAEFLHVALPAPAEHIHGLIRAEAQMEVSDGV